MAIISNSVLLYFIGSIFLLITAVIIYFKHAFKYWEKRGVTHPPPKLIFGNFEDSTLLRVTGGEVVDVYYKKYRTHKYIGAYIFHLPVFLAIDPDLVKNIMSKHFDHFVDRGAIHNEESDPLSAHLFTLEGQRWKNLRQKLTPTFTSGKLKKMFQTLVDCTEGLKSCFDESITKAEPVSVKKSLVQYTTDVIGSCAFGLECNSFKDPDSEFIRMGGKIFIPGIFDRCKMIFIFMFPSIAKLFKMRFTSKDVDYFFRKLVKDTIEYRERNNVTRNDFMQLLMQLKNKGMLDEQESTNKNSGDVPKLTLNEVTAQAFLFFVAGFETSSTTMTFCLYELAKNPKIQEKAREDIVSVLKRHDGKMTYDSVMEMQYMERVILETLRKHPPLMLLQRKVTKDYTVPDGSGLVLEKGLLVFIPAMAMQNDPEYFPNPDVFDPDRFTEENKTSRPDFTYLPFGDGPRVCIGLRFGMMQTKVGLCQLLLNYKFTLNPKTDDPLILDPEALLSCVKNGVWLNVEKIAS